MCQNTQNVNTHCQQGGEICVDGDGTTSVCLPDWQQESDGSRSLQTGPAPDGDIDAIVGMIMTAKAIEQSSDSRPVWYEELRLWADASASAFFKYEVNADDRFGPEYRLLRLGSCWGGWEGDVRDFQNSLPPSARSGSYAAVSTSEWNKLISTSHQVILAVQCSGDGAMVPNWATIGVENNQIVHSGGFFSGSSTPQNEYGSEAARTTFRVALDAALYPGDYDDWTPYLHPHLVRLRSGFDASNGQRTYPGCQISTDASKTVYIFNDWLGNAFIYGPTFSALLVGGPSDGPLIDFAGDLVSSLPVDYYPRCWALITNLMLSGAMESAGRTLQR